MTLRLVEGLIRRLGGTDGLADLLELVIRQAIDKRRPDVIGRLLVAMYDAGQCAELVQAKQGNSRGSKVRRRKRTAART